MCQNPVVIAPGSDMPKPELPGAATEGCSFGQVRFECTVAVQERAQEEDRAFNLDPKMSTVRSSSD